MAVVGVAGGLLVAVPVVPGLEAEPAETAPAGAAPVAIERVSVLRLSRQRGLQ